MNNRTTIVGSLKNFLRFSILLLLALPCHAQEEHNGGLNFDDVAYNKQTRQATIEGVKDLPSAVDLSPYCPSVRNQGKLFSCVGWAVGYGALSIQYAAANNVTDKKMIDARAFSALYIYNQIKTHCKDGAKISDAFQFLVSNGDCLAGDFDFNAEDCDKKPTSDITQKAKGFAIKDFQTLFGAEATPDERIRATKRALMLRKPVVIGLKVTQAFYQLKKAQYWWADAGNTSPAGGHALVVVGYDDTRQAFRILNSWGQNWGDEGFIWIKYNYFGELCKYAYVMSLYNEKAITVFESTPTKPTNSTTTATTAIRESAGGFEINFLEGWSENGEPQFLKKPVQRGRYGTYYLKPAQLTVGTRFQVEVMSAQAEQYLYVFSFDAAGEVRFHFPRAENFNPEKFKGLNESALMAEKDSRLTLPSSKKVFKMEKMGKDYTVILFSSRPIQTIPELTQALKGQTGNFTDILYKTLGKYMIPITDIRYIDDKMAFTSATRSEGSIIPLIIEIDALQK
jgi:hypothetical protein